MNFEVICPHCKDFIIIEQINCSIFRHGILKQNYTQISPHLPKIQCDELKTLDLIYGCGKPFKIVSVDCNWTAIECEYC